MADLATAYVQVIPSAEGVKGKLSSIFGAEMPAGGKSAGGLFGSSLISTVKKALATAGIGKVLKETILEGTDLEQSLGGVETLFQENAATVIANADQAYKTAGLSANSYMQQVTGFSASLLQSLGGDTAAAAGIANMALTDMSDNANKFGSDMSSITNAYQGFAKQNYTMLDNLKLGYGGTKKEMERLLKDATALTGVKYDISNLSDVYNAIHVIQDELGVTGTTALEAATTISGSFAAMKASFSNVLGNLTLGRDITPSLNALAQTTTTFLKGNLTPAVLNIVKALPGAAFTFVKAMIPGGIKGLVNDSVSKLTQFLTTSLPTIQGQGTSVINNIVTGFLMGLPALTTAAGSMLGQLSAAVISALPLLMESGVSIISNLAMGFISGVPSFLTTVGTLLRTILQALMEVAPSMLESGTVLILNLLTGLVSSLPLVTETAMAIVSGLLDTFAKNFPSILQSGVSMILNLASGLIASLPQVVTSAAGIVTGLLSTFASYLPDLLAQGVSMIGQLVAGAISMLPDVISAAGDICKGIWNAVTEVDWISLGKAIIDGVLNGIKNAASSIFEAMKNIASQALQAAKDALGIHSPSRRARKEVGLPIAQGEALGITDGIPLVQKATRQLSASSMPDMTDSLRSQNRQPVTIKQDSEGDGRVVNVYQYIYSEAKTAADLMREARYEAETAVLLGV